MDPAVANWDVTGLVYSNQLGLAPSHNTVSLFCNQLIFTASHSFKKKRKKDLIQCLFMQNKECGVRPSLLTLGYTIPGLWPDFCESPRACCALVIDLWSEREKSLLMFSLIYQYFINRPLSIINNIILVARLSKNTWQDLLLQLATTAVFFTTWQSKTVRHL